MKDIFYDYMSKRLGEINIDDIKTSPGPVITISRLAGCTSQKLTKGLAKRLNQTNGKKEWTVLSKEVLHESAQKLQLDPKTIKSIFKTHDRNVMEDILNAFLSKDYQLERKMRNTVINVIRRFAVEGHKIIVGRGANIICSDIQNALHIRLVGPLDWRVNRVMKTKNYTHDYAVKCITDTENNRSNFRKSIKGRKVDFDDYDITFNQSKFNTDEMIEMIVSVLKLKKMI